MKNKGTNMQQSPDSGIHQPIVNVCTKFQPSRPHNSQEERDEIFLMFEYWRKRK